VFCKVSIVYTSILILQTSVLLVLTLQPIAVLSTMSSVIRVLPLMMQVCSIAHTFLFRWFVQLVRIPSNPKSALRPVMVLPLTPSQKEPIRVWDASVSTATVTTEELRSRTLCDQGCCGAGCPNCPFRPPARGVFFCI